MTTGTDLNHIQWHKSSYSNGSGGDCVEVAQPRSGLVVRDSKRRSGPVVRFRADAWGAFVGELRDR
jgi:uncharacterized protein DUF397